MKKNNKGFMLMETLIVSTFLVTILLFLYIQFNSIIRNYNKSFSYNKINDLYSVHNIVEFISNDIESLNVLAQDIVDTNFIELYSQTDGCPQYYFNNYSYCNTLMSNLKIKKAIFTKQNLESLKASNDFSYQNFDQGMIDFINYIDYDVNDNENFRIIVQFENDIYDNENDTDVSKNDTYATLKIESSDEDE